MVRPKCSIQLISTTMATRLPLTIWLEMRKVPTIIILPTWIGRSTWGSGPPSKMPRSIPSRLGTLLRGTIPKLINLMQWERIRASSCRTRNAIWRPTTGRTGTLSISTRYVPWLVEIIAMRSAYYSGKLRWDLLTKNGIGNTQKRRSEILMQLAEQKRYAFL